MIAASGCRIETDRGDVSARGIINATGTWETPYIPDYPGADASRAGSCTPETIARPKSSLAST